jgi:hypothetical protein
VEVAIATHSQMAKTMKEAGAKPKTRLKIPATLCKGIYPQKILCKVNHHFLYTNQFLVLGLVDHRKKRCADLLKMVWAVT